MTREAMLTRTLVDLADTLVDEFDVVDLLTRLADHCVEKASGEASEAVGGNCPTLTILPSLDAG